MDLLFELSHESRARSDHDELAILLAEQDMKENDEDDHL